LKNNIRVDSCNDIIQYNTISPFHSFQDSDRRWFDDIEKSEEKEAQDDEKDRLLNPEHGDQEAHHLVDDNPWIILLTPISLGLIRNPTREEEEGHER